MKSFVNRKVSDLPPSGIRKFFDLVISAGPEVISLGVGEPDFPTPWHIRESAIYALEKGFTGYSENLGLRELRQEIARFTFNETQQNYDPNNQIIVTNGVSEAMDLAFRATIEPDEIVLVPDPGYVMYEPLIKLAGGKVHYYDPLNINTIKIVENTKGIVLNYPGNPLGNTFNSEQLATIASLVKKHNLLVYSDEIYGGLSYVHSHKSFISIPDMIDNTLLFNGFSKTHAMTGLRLGWTCGPDHIIDAMNKIHQYAALCACSISQIAGLEALRHGKEEAATMFKAYNERRKFCIDELTKLAIPFCEPQGAFYIFVDISVFNSDDLCFCEELLREQRLALVPGSAFGSRGRGHFRMTFAASMEELREAFERLKKFVSNKR